MDLKQLVTDYDAKRIARLAAAKVVENLQVEESNLKTMLIAALKEANLSVAGNDSIMFTLRPKTRPQVLDWDKFYDFVAEQHLFHMMQRRISEAAIEEWQVANPDAPIPGIGSYDYDDLSRPQKVR